MNISKLNCSQSFGKTPVMMCNVKRADTKKKTSATVYQLNIFDYRDIADVKYSRTAFRLIRDITSDKNRERPYKEYFIMKDDRTGEVISCAATSNHIRVSKDKISGKYLLLDEYNQNPKYINPNIPMLGLLIEKAYENYCSNIVIGTSNIDEKSLKKYHFSQAQSGEWYMPRKKFANTINAAQEKFDIVI